jgi:hypothetical protein
VKNALLILVAALSFAAIAPADAGQRLSANELRSLFRGVLVGYYKDTREIKVQATRAGQVMAWFEGKVDTGTWKIVGDQICVAFKVWTSGEPKCRFVERDGPWFRAVKANGKSKIKFRR